MRIIPVSLGERSYEIVVGQGILNELGEAVKKLGLGSKQMIVTSRPVWSLYGTTVRDSLESNSFDVSLTTVSDDEEAKSFQSLTAIYDKLVETGFDRSSGIVALGGGVIGDLAGFAAATFMRGIGFVQVPTTLLAQVDSSIGGKTGVNHPKAKNLIGAFYQPGIVWSDVSTLESLPDREIRSGLAEVIKYAMIADPELFQMLTGLLSSPLDRSDETTADIVFRCCSIKARVVEEDEKEHGIRAILNYGHTIGHALEAITDYSCYTHGEAVAIGMIAAANISRAINTIDETSVERLKNLVETARLPTMMDRSIDPQDLVHQLDRDKKRLSGRLRWVLPRAIGQVYTSDQVLPETVLKVVKDMTASG